MQWRSRSEGEMEGLDLYPLPLSPPLGSTYICSGSESDVTPRLPDCEAHLASESSCSAADRVPPRCLLDLGLTNRDPALGPCGGLEGKWAGQIRGRRARKGSSSGALAATERPGLGC